MDLIDEQHLARGELAEHRDKIGGALNYRACGGMEVDAHFAGDDLCERRLAEPGRTEEQDMVERLAAGLRRFDEDAQIVAQLMLADEFIEGGRPDRAFGCVLLGLLRGDDTRARRRSSRQLLQARFDQHIGARLAAEPTRRRGDCAQRLGAAHP